MNIVRNVLFAMLMKNLALYYSRLVCLERTHTTNP